MTNYPRSPLDSQFVQTDFKPQAWLFSPSVLLHYPKSGFHCIFLNAIVIFFSLFCVLQANLGRVRDIKKEEKYNTPCAFSFALKRRHHYISMNDVSRGEIENVQLAIGSTLESL